MVPRVPRLVLLALCTATACADASRPLQGDRPATEDGSTDVNAPDGGTAVTVSTIEEVHLATLNASRFVGAENDGGGRVLADATLARAWETLTIEDTNGGALESGDTIHVRAGNGQYFQVAGSALRADASSAVGSTAFRIVKREGAGGIVAGDHIGIETASSMWWSALGGGGSIVDVSGDSLDAWETFTIGFGEAVAPPSTARQRVLDFFSGISGKHTLAGIENKSSSTPRGHTDEVAGLAGKTPALWGIDFGFGTGAVDRRNDIVAEAIRQWNAGAIVTFTYHACAPTRDEYCGWENIGGGTAQTRQYLSRQQWDDLFTPGTRINAEWNRRLDIIAGHFATLRDAGVSPVFRPFHEMNQCVFWWACHPEANGSVRLWRYTHDYLVHTKGLDNIVWAWNIQDFDSIEADAVTYNPGTAYFDLATLDIYIRGYTARNYQTMLGAAGGKPIGIGECQYIPSVETLASQPAWTYFMLWPDFIRDQRNLDAYRGVFGSERVTTIDEMPGFR